MGAVCETNDALDIAFPSLRTTRIDRDVYFISTQELEDRFPDLTPKQREDAICREHHTVFLMQIGGNWPSGQPHDGRAPDYDDWQLNGDILLWNPVLERASKDLLHGLRVDEAALDRQLTASGCDDRRTLPFHRMLLAGELLTIGGGIGQSRLCMMMIGTCHIGEVQASLWDQETVQTCESAGMSCCCKGKIRHIDFGKKRPCPALRQGRFLRLQSSELDEAQMLQQNFPGP